MADPTTATISTQKYQFLSGGGEMGELMRTKDWLGTTVGSPNHWPQSLRTSVSIVLQTKFPAFIFWGPDQTCFYNDAYRPSLGENGKHPAILGMPGEKAWPEIWHIIKPLMDQVLAGEESPFFEDSLIPIYRNGKIEDVYWTFCYSAIADESGKPAGVFVSCAETTDSVNDAKKITHSERKFKNLINESPIATAVFTGEDFVVELANSEALKLWGKNEKAIGRKITEVMPELLGQPYIDLLKNVYNTGETYYGNENFVNIEVENKIIPTYVNFIYKALRDSDDKIYGILTMGYNVTEQVEARKKLEYNEERLRLTADTAMLGTFDLKMPERIFFGSQRVYEIFGFKDSNILYDELFSAIHPDDQHIRTEANTLSLSTGRIGYEVRVVWPDQSIHWISTYGKVFYDDKNNPIRVLGTIMDITNQKKTLSDIAYVEQRFRNTVMQAPVGIAILRGPDYFVEMANQSYLELVDRREAEFVGKKLFDTLPEVRASVESLLDNVYKTGNHFNATEFAIPVKRNGAIENCYFNFTYQALREADTTISGIIVTVNEVTSLVKAKYLLAESEKQFRNVIRQSPIPMAIFRGRDYVIEMGNEVMFNNIWRKKEADIIGKKLLDVFPELNDQKYPELLKTVFDKGKILREKESVAYVRGDDGIKKFYFDYEYAPLFETDGTVAAIMVTVNDVTEGLMAKQKIEIEEARLRLAIEGTKLATWDLTLENRTIIHSARLAEIFGHDLSTKISHVQMRDQIHPADKAIIEKAFAAAMRSGIYNYEARIVKPDKTIGWIKVQGKVIYDDDSVAQRLIGTLADVTENKIAEEKSAMLAAIVESSEDAIISKTLEGYISSWNKGAQNVFGYTADEIIGKHITKLIPADRYEEEPLILKRIQQGESVEHFETKRITKKGEILDISLTISPIKDQAGTVIGASKIARNITSQKEFERLTLESESRLSIAIQAAELGTWEYDIVTKDATYSDRYLEIFGYSEDVLPSREAVLGQIHPDDLKMRTRALSDAIVSGYMNLDMRIIIHANEVRWIQVKGKVFYGGNNEPLKIMGTIMDITDEKLYSNKLQKSELLFKTISNAPPVGLWMTDNNGQNVFVNETWIKWTGMPLEEHYGHGWLSRVLEEDKIAVPSFKKAFNKKEKYVAEFRLLRADNELRWYLTEGYPYYDENGVFEGYAGSVTDITDIKKLEQQKDFFISMASHELKTPITSIKGYVQILMSMHKNSEDTFLKSSLATVNKQIGTLTKLIADLLDMSKIKSGSLQLSKEDFSINDMISETIDEIRHTQPGFDILFSPVKEYTVYADRVRIAQVLINFLTNAIKYSPHFNMVTVKCSVIENNVVVSVIDSGIGISKNDQEKIFQRFYRVEGKDEKTFPGFGIGLFIAAEIIQRHNGQIGVESEPGKGSVFSFSLPLEN
jgi:PAS domain S-box-containing protein